MWSGNLNLPVLMDIAIHLKGQLLCFLILLPFLQCYICFCACKWSWKLKRSKSAPTGGPLSHRKLCPLNTSSGAPPWILGSCDIILCHHVKHLHNVDLAQLLYCCWRCWLRHVWADQSRADWVFRRRGLKETGAKTDCAAAMDSMRKLVCFFE